MSPRPNTPAGLPPEVDIDRLPQGIVDKLTLMIRRIRHIILLRGILMVAATAMGLLLALMALDAAVVMLPRNLHAALSFCALLATAAVAWRVLLYPLRRRHTLTAIARTLEIRHPELEERISSAIELLGSPDPAAMKGSEALIAELVKAAEIDATVVQPQLEFTIRTARPYLGAVGVMAAVVALLLLLWPQFISRLLVRTLVPYANVGNAYASLLAVAPGNGRIGFGEALTISAQARMPGMTRAEVLCVGSNGVETVERMAAGEVPASEVSEFSMTFPSVQESFRYRVRAGSALSGYYLIRVERRPEVERFTVSYDYPAYAGLPPRTQEGAPGDIVAPAGSKVRLSARFNKPLTAADLVLDGKPVDCLPPAGATAAGPLQDRAWEVSLAKGQTGSWFLRLEDDIGMTNQPARFKLQSVPDARPTVAISEPAATALKLSPTDLVPITYVAQDDYGIGAATLFVTVDDGKPTVVDLPPPARNEARRDTWTGSETVDLSALDLSAAKTVRVRIGVSDTLPADLLGPQTGVSAVVSIQIDRQAAALSQQTVLSLEAQLRADLAAAKAKLEQGRDRTAADINSNPGAAVRLPDIKDIHRLAEDAEAILRSLAARAGESPLAELSNPLKAIADQHVEPAKKTAEIIPATDNDTERGEHANSMLQDFKDAVAALEDLAGKLDKAHENAMRLAALTDLAHRQEQLAQAAQKLASQPQPANKEEMEKWKQAQDEALKKVADLLKKDPEALSRQMEENQKAAQNLSEAARQLAEQQKALAEQPPPSPDGALKQQGDMAKKAAGLKDDTGALANKMEKLASGPEDSKPKSASEARRSVEAAADSMKSAMDKMAPTPPGPQKPPSPDAGPTPPPPPPPPGGANPPAPQASQQQASQQLQKASDKLAELAKTMDGQNKAAKPGESKTPSAGAKTPNAGSPAPGKGAGSKGQGEGGGKPGSTPSPGKTPGGPPGPGGKEPGAPGGEQPAPGTGMPNPSPLAKAFDKAAGAATAPSMAQAAPPAAQAAAALNQMASAMAQGMGMSSAPPGGSAGGAPGAAPDGSGIPGGGGDLAGSGGKWLTSGKTGPGGDLGAAEDGTASDYRDLVKRYFRAVAREGEKEP